MLNLPAVGKAVQAAQEIPDLRPGLETLGEYDLPEVSDGQLEAQ